MILTIKSSQGSLGKNTGCEKGPQAILKKLGKEADIEIEDKENVENIHELVEKHTENFSGILLGGDHSFSYGSIKQFMKENTNGKLVVFDAHADCVNNFKPPTHEDYLRVLIEEGIIEPEKITLIGTRAIDEVEELFVKVNIGNHYPMEEIIQDDTKLIGHLKSLIGEIYLSIDIDVLDPTEAPGTGYTEPNGMSLEKLQEYLKLIKKPKIIDLVEVNPDKDEEEKTVNAAAKILDSYTS